MSIWSEIKHAINSTLGTKYFVPLDEMLNSTVKTNYYRPLDRIINKELAESDNVYLSKTYSNSFIIQYGNTQTIAFPISFKSYTSGTIKVMLTGNSYSSGTTIYRFEIEYIVTSPDGSTTSYGKSDVGQTISGIEVHPGDTLTLMMSNNQTAYSAGGKDWIFNVYADEVPAKQGILYQVE